MDPESRQASMSCSLHYPWPKPALLSALMAQFIIHTCTCAHVGTTAFLDVCTGCPRIHGKDNASAKERQLSE